MDTELNAFEIIASSNVTNPETLEPNGGNQT